VLANDRKKFLFFQTWNGLLVAFRRGTRRLEVQTLEPRSPAKRGGRPLLVAEIRRKYATRTARGLVNAAGATMERARGGGRASNAPHNHDLRKRALE